MTTRAKRTVLGKAVIGLLAGLLSLSPVLGTHGAAHAQPKSGAPSEPPKPGDKPKPPDKKKPDWKLKKEATELYKEGKKKLGKGDYKGALDDFKKADEAVPGAAPKYNIAVCYDELGMVAESIQAYKTFIESNPGDKYKDRVIEAGKRVAELEASMMGAVTLVVTPAGVAGLSVKVDGKPVEGTDLKLEPGEHTVEVSAPGHEPQTLKVTTEQGSKQDLAVTLKPAAAGGGPEPGDDDDDGGGDEGTPDDGSALKIAGFVGLGVTVVGGVLTAVFGAQALSKKSDFDDSCPSSGATQCEDLADSAESKAKLADAFLGVTIAFGITSAVLLGLGFSAGGGEEGAARAPRVTPYAGPHGGGGVVTWSF